MRVFPGESKRARRRMLAARLLALALAAAVGSAAWGDRLVLKNGQSFDGRLVSRDGKQVVFEIHADGMILKRSFKAAEVARVEAGRLYAGRHYFVVPIRGRIGTDVTAEVLRRCLDIASDNLTKVVPDVVILDIDSPGGDLRELLAILQTLDRYPKLRIVSYVRHAGSAAAVLAMSRREIIVSDTASIGGAVVYKFGPQGIPENLQEKMRSFWRAGFRSVAARAGHNPLLVEGMMRMDIALSIVRRDGRTQVVLGEDGEPLKPKGRILSRSSAEAVKTGLALGIAADVASCNRLLGLGPWRELMPQTAGRIFEAWRHDIAGARQRYTAAVQAAAGLFNKAMADHPNRGKYRLDPGTRRFLPDSKAEWQKRSAACIASLEQAEDKLAEAGRIAQAFPQLDLPGDKLAELQRKCVRARLAVEAHADLDALPPSKQLTRTE